MVWSTTINRLLPSRLKPPNTCRPLTVSCFTSKVWMTCALAKVLISSKNWPLRLTPGMVLAPSVSCTRPTTPVRVPT